MNRIRLLPEQVANQIAAGEVVERPASVVKELVENALDAHAGHITVEIQAGGRSLIRVTDDGIGMSRDDALLCLERHATSKIQAAADLQAITTMGFRGEALPSLASVSRFCLTTREREAHDVAATQVIVHGGKIIEVKEAGAPAGTSVEARQLFFNLPARRKFLRSEETERAHIQHYLTLAALAYPEVAFSFLNDQRLIWQLPALKLETNASKPLAALKERWRALYGSDQDFMPVNFVTQSEWSEATEDGNREETVAFRVWGYLGAPGISRSTRENQHLFVNRRPIENRGLNYALLEGYHTALMKGRYPVCCLFLEVDPAEVDVNIHPAKREVKFRHEPLVRRWVTQAVRQTVIGYHAQSPAPGDSSPAAATVLPSPAPLSPGVFKKVEPAIAEAGVLPGPAVRRPEVALQQKAELPKVDLPTPESAMLVMPERAMNSVPPEALVSPVLPTTTAQPSSAVPSPAIYHGSRPVEQPGEITATPLLAVPLRIIGVVGRLYVVLESDRGLVLLDQHAAHERILYETMLKRLEQGQAPSQRLLLAETIELPSRDAHFLREHLPILARLGVGLSEFGDRTFLLDALPPFVRVSHARHFVLQVVDDLKATGQSINSWRLGEQAVAKTVCRHAVKAHDPLAGLELEKLLADLRLCAMPYTCPHGRPTLIEMNFRELEKRFGRVQ